MTKKTVTVKGREYWKSAKEVARAARRQTKAVDIESRCGSRPLVVVVAGKRGVTIYDLLGAYADVVTRNTKRNADAH